MKIATDDQEPGREASERGTALVPKNGVPIFPWVWETWYLYDIATHNYKASKHKVTSNIKWHRISKVIQVSQRIHDTFRSSSCDFFHFAVKAELYNLTLQFIRSIVE